MIQYVFRQWKLHRLEAVIEEGNESSVKLAERLGFKREGLMRESEIKNGKRINLMLYSLLTSDWKLIAGS
jgi:ribosomal-protein-alanine N-acetyltransferase